MDREQAGKLIETAWDDSIIPRLCDYIRIPNKSPLFDPGWAEKGHMDAAVALLEGWCLEQPVAGMRVEVVRSDGRTPVLLVEVDGDGDDTVLLYGHMDKQPRRQAVRPRRRRRRLRHIQFTHRHPGAAGSGHPPCPMRHPH